jgi:hypothetical protein
MGNSLVSRSRTAPQRRARRRRSPSPQRCLPLRLDTRGARDRADQAGIRSPRRHTRDESRRRTSAGARRDPHARSSDRRRRRGGNGTPTTQPSTATPNSSTKKTPSTAAAKANAETHTCFFLSSPTLLGETNPMASSSCASARAFAAQDAAQALRLRAIRYPTSRFHRLSSPLLDRRYTAWLSEADVGRLLPVCCPGLACRSRLASSGQSLWGPVGGKDGKGSAPLWFGARSAWHRCRPWQAGKRAKSRGFLPRCSSSCVRACPRRALLVLRGRRRRRLEPPGACPS